MAKILISGGTGLIGETLCRHLAAEGADFAVLTRNPNRSKWPAFRWDPDKGELDKSALHGVETIVHLAGAGIADKRWTAARRKEIVDSRVKTAALLLRACAENGHFPKAFISASGINYYGLQASVKVFTELDPAGTDFTAEVVKVWESAADAWQPHCRVVKLRISMVLSAEGGALKRLLWPVRKGLGAPLGSGRQWMPWIHQDDVVGMMLFAIRNPDMQGTFNAVAPEHVSNRQFTKIVARVVGKPLWLPPVPAFGLYLWFGRMAELVLKGNRASSEKITGMGYVFQYPELEPALRHLLNDRDPSTGAPS
jgi:hypothetical protein